MAETFTPTDSMAAAAKRALKWREEGKATGAGTSVGWTRAGQLARKESLSLDTVKRMYSYFSRHEVDKQGKGFSPGEEGYPSNGKIMWDAWGGDAGYSWSRAIVNRMKKVWEGTPFDITKQSPICQQLMSYAVDPSMSCVKRADPQDGVVTRWHIGFMECGAMAAQSAVNRWVVGSNPTTPAWIYTQTMNVRNTGGIVFHNRFKNVLILPGEKSIMIAQRQTGLGKECDMQ